MSERSGGRERSELSGASERVSGASERANERTNEQVAQYLRLDSWLFWLTVRCWCVGGEKCLLSLEIE